MPLAAILLLGALGQAGPGKPVPQAGPGQPVPQAGAEVRLEDRPMLVPPLPASVWAARKGFARVRKELEVSFREAERERADCAAELARRQPLGARLVLAPQAEAEARVLGAFIQDAVLLDLEEVLLDRWNAWQTTLLAQGLERPQEAGNLAGNLRLLSSSRAEVVDRTVLGGGKEAFEVVCAQADGSERSILRPEPRPKWFEVMAVERMKYGAYTEFAIQASRYADAQVAGLVQPWQALSARLGAGAAALLDPARDRAQAGDPALASLRLLARMTFMEHFRTSLWFCQVVWAHMAGERILPIQKL